MPNQLICHAEAAAGLPVHLGDVDGELDQATGQVDRPAIK